LKAVNDREGHNIGDRALQHIASSIREHKRASDAAARLGGDEFAIVLAGAGADEAAAVADRIRKALPALSIAAPRGLTASFGFAMFPDDGKTAAELLASADQALYNAKREGGNCVLAAA
jgi:diguanylate cyclase (GGDEF)-like protein